MALSDITQKISDEANKKAAFMKQVADTEIKKIKEEASTKVEQKKAEIAEIAVSRSESVMQKAKVLARMENGNALLKEKREIIDTVYEAVSKDLKSLDSAEYTKLIAKMLKKASASMPKGSLTIPVGKKHQTEEAIQKVGVEFHIKDEADDLDGGFIISDGKAELNLSFNYLLEKTVRPSTELDVAKLLFD